MSLFAGFTPSWNVHTVTISSCLDVKKQPIQWSKCCLCQLKNNEKLETPKVDSYVSLQSQLQDMHKLNALPSLIYNKLLDDGPGIAVTLQII